MRLSSSSSSLGDSRSLLKRSHAVAVATVFCICLLLPLVDGVEEPETGLKTANHQQDQPHGVNMDAKHARITSASGQHVPSHSRKNKPNKSFSKKYVAESSADFQQGKKKKSIYDKKYFDYLPAEVKDPLETPTDVSLAKRTNSRRFRRDADEAGQLRTKRHGSFQYPLGGYSYSVPVVYPGSLFTMYDPNYRPLLNNHYLPPVVNRPIPQQPDRSYLPPATQRPRPTEAPGMFEIGNRAGGQDDQNRFIFDTVYDPNAFINYQLVPGPRPRPSSVDALGPNSIQGSVTTTVRPPPPPGPVDTTRAITTTTPRPVIQHNSDDDFDWSTLGLSPDAVGSRLGFDGTNDNTVNSVRKEPSKCTWAIANCCSQFSDKIRYYCFEQNQCYGAFWGDNVCRGYYRLALAEIENYYNV